jgi:hypothetical protein
MVCSLVKHKFSLIAGVLSGNRRMLQAAILVGLPDQRVDTGSCIEKALPVSFLLVWENAACIDSLVFAERADRC